MRWICDHVTTAAASCCERALEPIHTQRLNPFAKGKQEQKGAASRGDWTRLMGCIIINIFIHGAIAVALGSCLQFSL